MLNRKRRGKLKEESNWIDGKRNGYCVNYNKNGQKESEKNYKNDKQNGLCKWYYEEALKKKVWDALFIHIIPQSSSTEIIIGYHNNHTSRDMEDYVKSWNGLGRDEIGYKLTDLFVAHVEDWGLSPRLFEKIPEERFRKFFELQAKYSTVVAEQKTNVGYNLFEGLL